ncbi:MAG: hypothetical protein U0L49_07475, partial [Eubacterium sp.]|nr:hypothetical protein [Eubacterium sp.]
MGCYSKNFTVKVIACQKSLLQRVDMQAYLSDSFSARSLHQLFGLQLSPAFRLAAFTSFSARSLHQ